MSKTHFGFRMVEKAVKESMGTFSNTVGQVFRNVASNYDVMNDLMSVGVHRLWKSEFIKQLDPGPNTKLLDVAGGTGDVALMFLDHLKQRSYPGSVTVVDINPAMLEIGQKKAQGLANIDFMLGNAESLDLPSESVDAYTIAFGIRNCTNIDNVIKEAFRVLKRGGKFQCLEFSHVPKPLEGIYDFYSFNVIPSLGHLVANDRESYQYLVESIRKFPKQDDFAQMIQNQGFTIIGDGYKNLSFGIAAIHSGFKI